MLEVLSTTDRLSWSLILTVLIAFGVLFSQALGERNEIHSINRQGIFSPHKQCEQCDSYHTEDRWQMLIPTQLTCTKFLIIMYKKSAATCKLVWKPHWMAWICWAESIWSAKPDRERNDIWIFFCFSKSAKSIWAFLQKFLSTQTYTCKSL